MKALDRATAHAVLQHIEHDGIRERLIQKHCEDGVYVPTKVEQTAFKAAYDLYRSMHKKARP